MILARIICLAGGYLFGLFQTGYLVGKRNHTDLHTLGSGNSGTTNAMRVLGKKAGITVLCGDVGKSLIWCLAVHLYFAFHAPETAFMMTLYAGLGVILGHNFPFYLHFKGGKGIACTAGLIGALLDWRFIVICILVFAAAVLLTRYVSVGSLLVETTLFILCFVWGQTNWPAPSYACWREGMVVMGIIMVMAFWRHRANLDRLVHGTENKVGSHAKE